MDKSHALALEKAVVACGGVSRLARLIDVGQSVVSNWRKRETLIDATHCVAIEREAKGSVTRRDLRPDDWHLIWPELAATTEGA